MTTYDMTTTRVFAAPLAAVWQAWSDAEQVKRWWGPTGFTAPVAEMDFREGGTSLVCMKAPAEYGGFEMYNTWTYVTIEPLAAIEFIHKFADKDGSQLDPATLNLPAGIPSEVRHVLTFKALDDDHTEFTVTEYGYANEEVVATSKAGMDQCLDKLAQVVE